MSEDLLLQEAKRLVDAEIALLDSMLETYEQLPERISNKQKIYLEREQIEQYIQILLQSKLKLDDYKIVIAVVGTMKAGKSTTINAIVGSEILPIRNLPMTALPTAVCHTPGKIDPILNFENIQPINDLIGQIRSVAANKKFETVDEDIKKLLSWIEKGNVCQKQYNGAEEIFSFLKRANDIVRLSRYLEFKFPYEKYKQIDDFPCIEIEFSHLEKKDNQKGKLILLDTPNPNEYGQSEELRKMLQEQLQRANVIFAVLDYTQLKSEAEAEVRDFLKKVSEKSEKIYAIVNKFDQKSDYSLDKEAVRDMVTNQLMKDLIKSKDQVFPVSSRNAFIANRVLDEILINNQLPSSEKETWVKEFGEKAFGFAYKKQKQIENITSVTTHANQILEESCFSEPIKFIIEKANENILHTSIDFLTERLDKIFNKFIPYSQKLLTFETTSTEDKNVDTQAEKEETKEWIKPKFKEIKKGFESIHLDLELLIKDIKNLKHSEGL